MLNSYIMKPLVRHLSFKQSVLINHFLHWKWFVVAFVVGSVLNMINQFDGLLGRIPVDYLKLVVTYFVPYCVSSISSWYSSRV